MGSTEKRITKPGERKAYRECLVCDKDALYLVSTGLLSSKFICDNCGNEPPKSDVVKSFREMLGEEKETQPDNKASLMVVCRECREEVSKSVKRCPHCGWKPKKRSGTWFGGSILLGLSPIGWLMGADALSKEVNAANGVWEEVERGEEDEVEQTTEEDYIETLEQLKELADEGVITEEEFEAKKSEMLDRI